MGKTANHIPYADGFVPPNNEECIAAIGGASVCATSIERFGVDLMAKCESPPLEMDPRVHIDRWKCLPPPRHEDDFLARTDTDWKHPVDDCAGQTFRSFVERQCLSRGMRTKGAVSRTWGRGKTFGLSWVGEASAEERALWPPDKVLLGLGKWIEAYYLGCKAMRGPDIQIRDDKGAAILFLQKQKQNADGGRRHRKRMGSVCTTEAHDNDLGVRQLDAEHLLAVVHEHKPRRFDYWFLLTWEDLRQTDSSFTVGVSRDTLRVGIGSLLRYACHGGGLFGVKLRVPPRRRLRLFRRRVVLMVLHELGHLLGMAHCIFYRCIMNGVGSLEENERCVMQLCPVCLHKVVFVTGCDVRKRYAAVERVAARGNGKWADYTAWIKCRLLDLSS
jgi:predicted Zn-dependent protease